MTIACSCLSKGTITATVAVGGGAGDAEEWEREVERLESETLREWEKAWAND